MSVCEVDTLKNAVENGAVVVDLRDKRKDAVCASKYINIPFDKKRPEDFDIAKLSRAIGSDKSKPIIVH